MYCRTRTYENFKLKICTCAQSHALGTHTKFQFKILTIIVISGILYFLEIMCKIVTLLYHNFKLKKAEMPQYFNFEFINPWWNCPQWVKIGFTIKNSATLVVRKVGSLCTILMLNYFEKKQTFDLWIIFDIQTVHVVDIHLQGKQEYNI